MSCSWIYVSWMRASISMDAQGRYRPSRSCVVPIPAWTESGMISIIPHHFAMQEARRSNLMGMTHRLEYWIDRGLVCWGLWLLRIVESASMIVWWDNQRWIGYRRSIVCLLDHRSWSCGRMSLHGTGPGIRRWCLVVIYLMVDKLDLCISSLSAGAQYCLPI